jgi:alpha-D-ribose 1-methylphosphonate 5-triphosphate diphosphatase
MNSTRIQGSQQAASHAARFARVDPNTNFVLSNARVVLADTVTDVAIEVRHGLIHRIRAQPDHALRQIDCAGDYLLPGLIELHTDNFERHRIPRLGAQWHAQRAVLSHDAELASAGITTAFDAVTLGADLQPDAHDEAYLSEILATLTAQRAGLLRVDHQLHLRCELSSPRMREQLLRARRIRTPRIVSLMDHTPGQGQWTDLARFRSHYQARYGMTCDQLDALIARRQRTRATFALDNRRFATRVAIGHEAVIASHDDCTVASIADAQRDGCRIAEFPTSLQAATEATRRGMHVIAGAPNLIRNGSHSGNVAASDLVRAGACDILSSDYFPASLLQGAFLLASEFDHSLPRAIASVSEIPARVLGLHDRGRIEEGKRADLVRVRNSAHGPVVIATWCAGRQVA